MKFLVLGATGMAGHTITIYLIENGHDVTTFSTKPFPFGRNVVGDAMQSEQLKELLLTGNFDVVINCIGMLNKDCDREPATAVFLNSYLPHYIADTLRGLQTRLIQMSTDCVFSGKSGSYTEKSFRDGETFYDRTKALGEVEDDKNLTFRNSIIGPDINVNGIGLFNWFMKQTGTIEGYSTAIWTGVTTITLAKAMEQAAIEGLSGIYNLVNNQTISKLEMLRLFNKHFKNSELIINPREKEYLNKSLINQRSDFSFQVPDYETMIIELKEWILRHPDLYPHYDVKR